MAVPSTEPPPLLYHTCPHTLSSGRHTYHASLRGTRTFKEDENISDDDDELDSAKDSDSAGGGGKKAPPSFAESCGIGDAGHFLNKAKMAFLAATFARPDGSWTFRVFADS